MTLIAKNEAEAKVLELRNEISKITDEKKDFEKRLVEAESDKKNLTSELNVALVRMDKYETQNDVKVLDGRWLFTIEMHEEYLFGKPSTAYANTYGYELEILEGIVVKVGIDVINIGRIIFFNYDYFEGTAYAVFSISPIPTDEDGKYILHYQVFDDIHIGLNGEINIMKGTDVNGNKIEYTRVEEAKLVQL